MTEEIIEFPDREIAAVKKFVVDISAKSNTYVLQAIALTAALSFNSAVKSSIDAVYPYEKGTLTAEWIYAITVLFILVMVIYLIGDNKPVEKKEGYASKRNFHRLNRNIIAGGGALAFY